MTEAETRFTVEPQPGRWDTKLGRIVTALEDAAYERGRAEATAAAEQRLRSLEGALRHIAEVDAKVRRGPGSMAARFGELLTATFRADDVLEATPPPAPPRQGEPVEELRKWALSPLTTLDAARTVTAGEVIAALGQVALDVDDLTNAMTIEMWGYDFGDPNAAKIAADLAPRIAARLTAALSEPAEAGEPAP